MIHELLLAQGNHLDRLWDEVSASFRGDRSTLTTFTTQIAVVVLAALAVLAVLWMIRSAVRRRNPAAGPASLLRAAVRAAGFGWIDRALLVRVARRATLDHPLVMLLAPPVFQEKTAVWLSTLPLAVVRDWARKRLTIIEHGLFGQPETPS